MDIRKLSSVVIVYDIRALLNKSIIIGLFLCIMLSFPSVEVNEPVENDKMLIIN